MMVAYGNEIQIGQGGGPRFGRKTTFGSQVVFKPSAVQVVAADEAITPSSVVIPLTADDPVTLAATPTIQPGVNGQEILLINIGEETITLQNEGELVDSGLRLEAATLDLVELGSVRLGYVGALGQWVQVSPVTTIVTTVPD